MKNSFKKYSIKKGISFPIGKFLLLFIVILLTSVTSCKTKKDVHVHSETEMQDEDYYTCSMHPQIRESKPGKCPICGMQLIKVSNKTTKKADEILLTDQQILLANIKLDSIRNAVIGDKIYLTGTLNFNLNQSTSVSSRIMGRIEKLYFKNLGDYVRKGDKLFDIYSEELNNVKQEYILALQQQSALDNTLINYNQLVESAKNKLELLGLSESQINELKTSRKSSPITSFYSTASGYITNLNIKEGDYTMEGGTIVTLADLSTLWAEAQVYTSQLSEFDRNGVATVQVSDIPEKQFKGRIEYINPEISPDTRIDLIRVTIPNADHKLKPGMPAYVIINSTEHKSFTLPIDAVLRDDQGAVVWVQTNHNTFAVRMVQVGLESGDRIEILSGLQPGDVVVTSGSYLLNSEYKFKVGSNPMAGMKM